MNKEKDLLKILNLKKNRISILPIKIRGTTMIHQLILQTDDQSKKATLEGKFQWIPFSEGENIIKDGDSVVAKIFVNSKNEEMLITERNAGYVFRCFKERSIADMFGHHLNSVVFFKKNREEKTIKSIQLYLDVFDPERFKVTEL